MLNRLSVGFIATLLIALASAATSAQTFRLALEEPVNGATASGVSNIRGWAVADVGIDRVEIFIDGNYAFDVPYGGLRVDVGNVFPDVLASSESGFGLTFNYGDLGDGTHTLRARAVALDGSTVEQTAEFEVIAFPRPFLQDADKPSLSDVEVAIDADDEKIELKGVRQNGDRYDLELVWSTASQSFQVVDLDSKVLPSSCITSLPKRDIPSGVVLSKGFTRNLRLAGEQIRAGSGFDFRLVNGELFPVRVEEITFEDDDNLRFTARGEDLPGLNAGVLGAEQAVSLSFNVPESGAMGEIDVEIVLSLGSECFSLGDELFDTANTAAPAGYLTSASGLQYAVIEAGDGETPTANDSVRVHYIGLLEDGTVFDSSYARGEPLVFGVNQLIAGFSEALLLMNEGMTLTTRIPPGLGYGSRAVGVIPPNSTLLFEITLIDIL